MLSVLRSGDGNTRNIADSHGLVVESPPYRLTWEQVRPPARGEITDAGRHPGV
jgi:hypothetical protein